VAQPVPVAPGGHEPKAERRIGSDAPSDSRISVIVRLGPAAPAGSAADRSARGDRVAVIAQQDALLARLRPLGAELKARLTAAGQNAIIVEVPAGAVERIRQLPGVRSVGAVRDAGRGPPPLPER
jgi:hypothetical protein